MRKFSALLRMIPRSTTQHLFASVEGEERTVLFSPPANRTPIEYSQVTVPELNIDSLPVVVPAVEEKFSQWLRDASATDARGPGEFFCMSVARMFEQPGSLEKGLILHLSCRCNFDVFPDTRDRAREHRFAHTRSTHDFSSCQEHQTKLHWIPSEPNSGDFRGRT